MKTISFLFTLLLCGMLMFGPLGCNAERSVTPVGEPTPDVPAPEIPDPVPPRT